jgi:hypothetical protein
MPWRAARGAWTASWRKRRRLHPNFAEFYAREVAALHEALADPATRDEALEITRGLIERVRVNRGERARQLRGGSSRARSRRWSSWRKGPNTGCKAVRDAFRRSRNDLQPSAGCLADDQGRCRGRDRIESLQGGMAPGLWTHAAAGVLIAFDSAKESFYRAVSLG